MVKLITKLPILAFCNRYTTLLAHSDKSNEEINGNQIIFFSLFLFGSNTQRKQKQQSDDDDDDEKVHELQNLSTLSLCSSVPSRLEILEKKTDARLSLVLCRYDVCTYIHLCPLASMNIEIYEIKIHTHSHIIHKSSSSSSLNAPMTLSQLSNTGHLPFETKKNFLSLSSSFFISIDINIT